VAACDSQGAFHAHEPADAPSDIAAPAFAQNWTTLGRTFDPLESWNCAECRLAPELFMPLAHVDRPGHENALGVHFPMRHDATTVRVVVIRRVLQDMKSAPLDGEGYMARFEAFRKEFEAIASDKFDDGRCSGKIEITSSDMVKFLVERLNAS
jgi:hypothetical protein